MILFEGVHGSPYRSRVRGSLELCFLPCEKNTRRVLKKYVRASRNPYKIRLKLKNRGSYGGIFRSQPQLCNKSGRVSFDDPLTSPACGAGAWATPPEKPEYGDIVPPGGVAVKHYTTPPSLQ